MRNTALVPTLPASAEIGFNIPLSDLLPTDTAYQQAEDALHRLRTTLEKAAPTSPTPDALQQSVQLHPLAWKTAPLPASLANKIRTPSRFAAFLPFLGVPASQWTPSDWDQLQAHLWKNMFLFAPEQARRYHQTQEDLLAVNTP